MREQQSKSKCQSESISDIRFGLGSQKMVISNVLWDPCWDPSVRSFHTALVQQHAASEEQEPWDERLRARGGGAAALPSPQQTAWVPYGPSPELLAIRDMQSGAKLCSGSISDVILASGGQTTVILDVFDT